MCCCCCCCFWHKWTCPREMWCFPKEKNEMCFLGWSDEKRIPGPSASPSLLSLCTSPSRGRCSPHDTSTRSRVPIEVGKTTLLWPSRRPLEAMRRRRGFPFSTTDTTLRTRVLRGFDVEPSTIFTTSKWPIIVSYERVSSIYRVSAPSHAQLSQNRNKVGGGGRKNRSQNTSTQHAAKTGTHTLYDSANLHPCLK